MKHFRFEYGAVAEGIALSGRFKKELARQITPMLLERIEDETLRAHAAELVRLSLDGDPRACYAFLGGENRMVLRISALPLILCRITVAWRNAAGTQVFPWEEAGTGGLTFSVSMEKDAERALNHVLPQLHHPVIRAAESGLSFDYQIYMTNEGDLALRFGRQVTEGDAAAVERTVTRFCDEWNAEEEGKIRVLAPAKRTKMQVKLAMDFGGCPREAILRLIRCFDGQDGVKMIVFR